MNPWKCPLHKATHTSSYMCIKERKRRRDRERENEKENERGKERTGFVSLVCLSFFLSLLLSHSPSSTSYLPLYLYLLCPTRWSPYAGKRETKRGPLQREQRGKRYLRSYCRERFTLPNLRLLLGQ